MTLIARIFLALALAVTLSFTSSTSPAHAAVFSLPIPSGNFDAIISAAQSRSETDLEYGGVAVINETQAPLTLSGVYKDKDCSKPTWPFGEIPPKTMVVAEVEEPDALPCAAANYQVGKNAMYVQLAVTQKRGTVNGKGGMSNADNQNSKGVSPAEIVYMANGKQTFSEIYNVGSAGVGRSPEHAGAEIRWREINSLPTGYFILFTVFQ